VDNGSFSEKANSDDNEGIDLEKVGDVVEKGDIPGDDGEPNTEGLMIVVRGIMLMLL